MSGCRTLASSAAASWGSPCRSSPAKIAGVVEAAGEKADVQLGARVYAVLFPPAASALPWSKGRLSRGPRALNPPSG